MDNKKEMPVEQEDIEDAVRRLWQLEDFLEELVGILSDNNFFPRELQDRFQSLFSKKF